MMKTIIVLLIAVSIWTACNSNKRRSTDKSKDSMTQTNDSSGAISQQPIVIKRILSSYFLIKNALSEDNSTRAATAGKELVNSFINFDKTVLSEEQQVTYENVETDAREHAEHIGQNSGDIVHQRAHFDLLSKDIYILVKEIGGGQVLYKVSCPMYEDGKGAFWINDTKEIKNPYFGKEMLTHGKIEEEIK